MAGPKTESNGRIVRQEQAGQAPAARNLHELISRDSMKNEIARALPRHITPDRIVRIVTTALRTTRNLAECTPESFLGCVLQSAQLGLEVNTPLGHAWLIPRRNNRANIYECTLIIGYQGQIELSSRSGRIGGIGAHVVRKGDFFEYELGLNPRLVHRHSEDPDRELAEITHAYAVARVKDAEPVFEVLSVKQLQARAARSSAGENGPWSSDTEAMCRKTAVRALWKWIPKSAEMALAEQIETAVELGKQQSTAFDPVIHEALSRQGVEPILTHGEEPTKTDETLANDPSEVKS